MKAIIAMILLSACVAGTEAELGEVEQQQTTLQNCVDIKDGTGKVIGKECTSCDDGDGGLGIPFCQQVICDTADRCSPGSLDDTTPTRPGSVVVPAIEIDFDGFGDRLKP
jgi:hypothetical protein